MTIYKDHYLTEELGVEVRLTKWGKSTTIHVNNTHGLSLSDRKAQQYINDMGFYTEHIMSMIKKLNKKYGQNYSIEHSSGVKFYLKDGTAIVPHFKPYGRELSDVYQFLNGVLYVMEKN